MVKGVGMSYEWPGLTSHWLPETQPTHPWEPLQNFNIEPGISGHVIVETEGSLKETPKDRGKDRPWSLEVAMP